MPGVVLFDDVDCVVPVLCTAPSALLFMVWFFQCPLYLPSLQVPRRVGQSWCETNKIVAFFETSARTGTGVQAAFLEIAKLLIAAESRTNGFTSGGVRGGRGKESDAIVPVHVHLDTASGSASSDGGGGGAGNHGNELNKKRKPVCACGGR